MAHKGRLTSDFASSEFAEFNPRVLRLRMLDEITLSFFVFFFGMLSPIESLKSPNMLDAIRLFCIIVKRRCSKKRCDCHFDIKSLTK